MAKRGRIFVIAGTNGAGKSRIGGEFYAREGAPYYNPDERTRELVAAGLDLSDANARGWTEGYDRLRWAIDHGESFTLETTLGGQSICRELQRAAKLGLDVRVLFVGLATPELHIQRVRARVARGGHDIPEEKIRERYTRSLSNLISLIGTTAEIHVFDNSEETADGRPHVRLVMRIAGPRIVAPEIKEVILSAPDWAKPIVAAALRVHKAGGRRR